MPISALLPHAFGPDNLGLAVVWPEMQKSLLAQNLSRPPDALQIAPPPRRLAKRL